MVLFYYPRTAGNWLLILGVVLSLVAMTSQLADFHQLIDVLSDFRLYLGQGSDLLCAACAGAHSTSRRRLHCLRHRRSKWNVNALPVMMAIFLCNLLHIDSYQAALLLAQSPCSCDQSHFSPFVSYFVADGCRHMIDVDWKSISWTITSHILMLVSSLQLWKLNDLLSSALNVISRSDHFWSW